MAVEQQQAHYREPSRAKVLQFARAALKDEAASDSEIVNSFAAAMQALLMAYVHALNNSNHADHE